MTEIQFFNQLKKKEFFLHNTMSLGKIVRTMNGSCPIIAVAASKDLLDTKDYDTNNNFKKYAKRLGLDYKLAKEIVLAADNRDEITIKRSKCDPKRVQKLRQKLHKLVKV